MPSLLDVAPPDLVKRQVDIRGTKVDIEGVRNAVWVQLYDRHPVLAAIVQGKVDGADLLDVMEAQAALIAAGTGHPLDPEHEEAAFANFSAADQQKLVGEIITISMPGEIFGPLRRSARRPNGTGSSGALENGGKGSATS